MSQPQVCARVAQLLPRLQTLLHAELPELNEVLIDGTERPIARPRHKGRRDRHCSGRRKRCTLKNVVVTAQRRVVLLTPTAPGRRHDKREADAARLRLGGHLRVLGGQQLSRLRRRRGAGLAAAQETTRRPLHWRHQRSNRKLARQRVVVEHMLASVKRLGILRQPLRARCQTTADLVMLIGCGLHNYRLDQAAAAQN